MAMTRLVPFALVVTIGSAASAGNSVVSAGGDFAFVQDGFGTGSVLEDLAVDDSFQLDLSVVEYEEVFDAQRGGGETRQYRGSIEAGSDFLFFVLAATGAPVEFGVSDGGLAIFAQITNDVDFGAGLRDEVILTATYNAAETDPFRGVPEFEFQVFASFPDDTWDTIDPTRPINLEDAIFSGATLLDDQFRAARVNPLLTFTTPAPTGWGLFCLTGWCAARRRR